MRARKQPRTGKPPRARASFLLARMGSYRLVLGAALVTAIVTATLTAALASFATGALPRAVHRQLVTARGTSVVVSGAVNAEVARADDRVVRQSLRATFSGAVTISGARWSDPLELSVPHQHQQVSLVQAAAPGGVRARVVLTAGSWPGPPARARPAAVPAAVPAVVASELHLAPGDIVRLRDRDTGTRVRFRVTGIFRPRNRASAYWQLTPAGAGGSVTSGRFVTYGPIIVAAGAFSRGQLAVGGASWLALPSTRRIAPGDLTALAARVTTADQSLTQSGQLGGLQVSTSLPGVLLGIAKNDVVAASLLVIGELQLLLLAVAALALAASLLASQREGEIALLSARGGARWQLTRLGSAESVLLAGAAVVAGGLAGGRLASRLARSGPLDGARLRLPAAPGIIWIAAGLIGLLCALLLLWPTFRAPALAAAARQARPARAAGLARAGADLALVAVALVAIWQLRRYQAVSQGTQGSLAIDPVLTAAPVLGLAAGTALLLRLVPLAARAGDRLAARSRRLGAALASWEISRQPVRQSAPVLLVVLAAATSTLALAQHQSWRRSIQDQAAFSVGADLQVNTPGPTGLGQAAAIARAPGVLGAMPVARTGTGAGTSDILALTARQAAATVLLRRDLSALSPVALWRRITPARTAGLVVPGQPARLAISASLSRGQPAAKFGPLQAQLDIMDAAGVSYSLPVGSLPADGRVHRLIASLGPARRQAGRQAADYPLRLTAIAFAYTLPVKAAGPEVLTIGGIATATGRSGRFAAPFSTGRAISGWAVPMSAPGLSDAIANAPEPGQPSAGPQRHFPPVTGRTGERLGFEPGYGLVTSSAPGSLPSPIAGTMTLAAPPAAGPIPAIATTAYLAAADLSVGDTATVTFGAASVRARIAGVVTRFPTVTGEGGALIMDLAALQATLTSQSGPNLPVSQWWLRTRPAPPQTRPGPPQTRPGPPAATLPPGTTVASRAQTAEALLAAPLSGLPQQALPAIALAAAALAAVGFSVSVAASVTKRQAQRALLAALGVSRRAQAGQLCLEQLMLSVPAAAAGLLLGAALARLLIRPVTLTATAAAPVPPVLIEIPWALAAGLAAAVAIIPVLAAGLTIIRAPDPAAQLRAAETV